MNGALAFPFPAWQPTLCHSVVNVVAVVVVVVVLLPRSLWLPTTTNIPSAAVWPTAPPSAKMGQMKTAKSKAVAQAIIKGFRKTCQDVVESGGMAARKG